MVRALARALGVPEVTVEAVLLFLVASHDCGKATPEFQCRLPEVKALLRNAGVRVDWKVFASLPHATVSESLLRSYLAWREWPSIGPDLSIIAGAHHGEIAHRQHVQEAMRTIAIQDDWWRLAQCELLDFLWQFFALDGSRLDGDLPGGMFGVLAGLITVSDWLASNEHFFPYDRDHADPQGHFAEALGLAERALDEVGWREIAGLVPTQKGFEEMFGFAPRELQSAVREIASAAVGPTLILIEAGTGEGKTEAAFDAAATLQRINGHKGLYAALPTQATGNQTFSRLINFLNRQASDAVGVQLVHSARRLNPLVKRLRLQQPGRPGVELREWFSRSKLALLAPYGAGTVDQALMSVLNTRHFTLRLHGLSNTTVIFDEVHACDLYTSGLLMRLLEWLKSMGSSAVVMTATLPESMRMQILNAWGADAALDLPYPRIVSVSAAGVTGKTFTGRPVPRTRLEPAPHEPHRVARFLADLVNDGGCAVMVASTIDRAIDIYGAAKRAARTGTLVMLLHSRFPAHARLRIEQALAERFGPPVEGTRRPGKAIVVATQVIEQSLDLDFDVMLSDPAPIDLLLQRMGRLHRHDRARPEHHSEPVLYLCGLNAKRPPPTNPHAFVYGRYLLYKTWHAVRERSHLHPPSDSDALLYDVYETGVPTGLPHAQAEAFREALAEHEAEQGRLKMALRSVRMPAPDRFFSALPGRPVPVDGLSEEAVAALHAETRLGRTSVTVIPLIVMPDGSYRGLTRVILDELDHAPDLRDSESLFETHVRVGDPRLVAALKAGGVPAGWQRDPFLRNCYPLVLQGNEARIAEADITLDPELGLVIRRN